MRFIWFKPGVFFQIMKFGKGFLYVYNDKKAFLCREEYYGGFSLTVMKRYLLFAKINMRKNRYSLHIFRL